LGGAFVLNKLDKGDWLILNHRKKRPGALIAGKLVAQHVFMLPLSSIALSAKIVRTVGDKTPKQPNGFAIIRLCFWDGLSGEFQLMLRSRRGHFLAEGELINELAVRGITEISQESVREIQIVCGGKNFGTIFSKGASQTI